MSYIPLIKRTSWIDLSPEHKNLRLELQDRVLKACANREQIQPMMLQGAFGIGKTNSLYYIFHYAWCELKVPAFYVSLENLTKAVKGFAKNQESNKIQNDELGRFINELITNQIDLLNGTDWTIIEDLYFPEYNEQDLQRYLRGFNNVEITEETSEKSTIENVLSEDVIRDALSSGNRPILLIDEFESKFYELKKHIETSGGGVLRELFDQIVQDTNLFYLIIGNGPASGYEIAKERGDDATDSETAANRRLITKSIPFPTSNLLRRSFLKDQPRGYINFIWWLSRCRPGHIQKLKDSLGSIEDLKSLTTNELISKPIFKEPIDEGGEAVTYLKTEFFNEVEGKIQALVLGKTLLEFCPLKFEIENYKEFLTKSDSYFYCASKTISTEVDLIPALRADLYVKHLKSYQNEGKYESVNYIEHIQPFFGFILSSISDDTGNIAFGMINDRKPDEILAKTFLIPLLELTYDFISLFQDDSIKEIKESLNFLLKIINEITQAVEKEELITFAPFIYDSYEKCKLLRHENVYLQLSLHSIREAIEQPIGSPKIKYKSEQLSLLLNDVDFEDVPLIYHKEENLHTYFIPSLSESQLNKYLDNLEDKLNDFCDERFRKNGRQVFRIIYLDDSPIIDTFRTKILFSEGDIENPKPLFQLKKIDIVSLESFQLNFSGQIKDYIDSISKIGLIGVHKGEIEPDKGPDEDFILNLEKVVKSINSREWTKKKETLRTIEHYRKLLFEGDNSTFSSIKQTASTEYIETVGSLVCKKDEFKLNLNEYNYLDKLIHDESQSFDAFTKNISLLYLFENNRPESSLIKLLELCKSDYRFNTYTDNSITKIVFNDLLKILTKDKINLDLHAVRFNLESEFIQKLHTFTQLLLDEKDIESIDDYFTYLEENSIEENFIRTYHENMGGYKKLPEFTETLYNLAVLGEFNPVDLTTNLKKRVDVLTDSVNDIRTSLVEILDELKDILDEEKGISNYPGKLGKVVTGFTIIKAILANDPNNSTLLIVSSIVKHLEEVIQNSKKFNTQLKGILSNIQKHKLQVDDFQMEIDDLYKDPLTETLLNFEYPVKRNNGYLWKKNYLKDHLKINDAYEKLFGESKNYYNPFSKATIQENRIEAFNNCLSTISTKLITKFNENISKMNVIGEASKNTSQLKDFITQLLITTGND